MGLKQFFTFKYLFEINRVLVETLDKWFFVVGLVLVILAIVFKLAVLYAPDPVNKKYRQKFFSLFLSVGVSLMVWYGARVENVNFFGTHFVAWLIVLIGLVWFFWVVAKIIRNFGKDKREWDKEQVKRKYLPN